MEFLDWVKSNLDIIAVVVTIATPCFSSMLKYINKRRKEKEEVKKWKKERIKQVSDSAYLSRELSLILEGKIITTYGQMDESPDDNPDKTTRSEKSFPLVEWFLNEFFAQDEKSKREKRYAILGGSGMGKSTFVAELCHRYIEKCSSPNKPYPINVLELGDKDVFYKIKEIEKKEGCTSILILDGLDENTDAINDSSSYLTQLDELVQDFEFVLITCRTQFFPDAASEPFTGLSNPNVPPRKRSNYKRIYISPFTGDEIKIFLENKYGLGDKYNKAYDIAVKRTDDLMFRPLILEFIDDLLDINVSKKLLTDIGIYKIIIDKWLKRECDIIAKDGNIQFDESDLLTFSKKMAICIYNQRERSKGFYLEKNDYSDFINRNHYSNIANPEDFFRGRTLINRKINGEIKFSHKSFLEYFIALDSLENPGKSYNFYGMDMARCFVDELYQLYLDEKLCPEMDYRSNSGEFKGYIKFYIPENRILDSAASELTTILEQLGGEGDNENINDRQENHKEIIYELWTFLVHGKIPLRPFLTRRIVAIKDLIHRIDSSISNQSSEAKKRYEEGDKSLFQELLRKTIESKTIVVRLFNSIQTSFFEEGISNESVSTIKGNIEVLKKLISEVDFPFYTIQKDTILVIPNFFSKEQQIIDRLLMKYTPVIGLGFYKSNSAFSSIECILKRESDSTMYLLKQSDNIDDIIKFVIELSKQVRGLEDRTIVVESIVDGANITYVCNGGSIKYTNEQITKCLRNMYSAAMKLDINKSNNM